MIKEYIRYFFHSISCPGYIKKIGLLAEIIAIEARHERCKAAWQPHLDKCKSLIIEEANKLKNKDRVLVLGAGSLHDVPLKELSELFDEVHLVDIFFLQSAINQTRDFDNVDFHQVDITGVLEKAIKKIDSGASLDGLSKELPKHFLQDQNIDMVISLNLLSQLPLAIAKLCEDERFLQSLIENHLAYLRCFATQGSKALLITDIEKTIKSKGSTIRESSLQGLDESIFNGFEELDSWDWHLAPEGELSQDYSLELKVKAFVTIHTG